MANESASQSGGIGVLGGTFLVFLLLKLTGHIDWSWWWITAPLWVVPAVGCIILIVVGFAFMGAYCLDACSRIKGCRKR